MSFPLKKEGKFFDNFFTAKGSLMYSPNSNKDLKSLDRKIDINNIFTQNRLSLDDTVEGGQSLTLGGEYILKGKEDGNNIFKAGLASVLRDNEEINLPTKSTINNKSASFRSNKEAMEVLVEKLNSFLKISKIQGSKLALKRAKERGTLRFCKKTKCSALTFGLPECSFFCFGFKQLFLSGCLCVLGRPEHSQDDFWDLQFI